MVMLNAERWLLKGVAGAFCVYMLWFASPGTFEKQIPRLKQGILQSKTQMKNKTKNKVLFENSATAPRVRRPKIAPLPIFVASLPKSGTTSAHKYFICGGRHRSMHTGGYCGRLGQRIETNIKLGKRPFDNCSQFDAFSDAGYLKVNYTNPNASHCYYPSLNGGLEAMYQAYQNFTVLLVVRNETEWVQSVKGWYGLKHRWSYCRFGGNSSTQFPGPGAPDEEWESFYIDHANGVEDFATRHPSINFLRVKLEDEDAGYKLEEVFNISSSCWKKCKPNKGYGCDDLKNSSQVLSGIDNVTSPSR